VRAVSTILAMRNRLQRQRLAPATR